jgi:hypothetical protein
MHSRERAMLAFLIDIHNVRAGDPPENVVAAFETALGYGQY